MNKYYNDKINLNNAHIELADQLIETELNAIENEEMNLDDIKESCNVIRKMNNCKKTIMSSNNKSYYNKGFNKGCNIGMLLGMGSVVAGFVIGNIILNKK